MNKKTLELVTEFDDEGNIISTEHYFTRPNISLSLVYECVDFLESLETNKIDYHLIADIVTRIYDNQFTKSQLLNGLMSYDGRSELLDQIVFVAIGEGVESKGISKDNQKEVNSWSELKNNLRTMIQDTVKKGDKDINDVLNTPFYFFVQELNEQSKVIKKEESMLDAFM